MDVTKNDIKKLTIPQLKSIYKNIKQKLGLQVMGKKKEEMVEQLFKLHDNSVIRGKKLFTFDNSGHIKIPMGKKTKAKPETKPEAKNLNQKNLKQNLKQKNLNQKKLNQKKLNQKKKIVLLNVQVSQQNQHLEKIILNNQ